MSTSRRSLLAAGAGLAALACFGAACSDSGPDDPPGTHPALRRPRPFGAVAFVGATGDPATAREALLRLRGPDVMIGLGATLTSHPGLVPMPPFPGEVLIPGRSNPDAFVQLEGDDADTCAARLDAFLAGLPLQVRWRTPVHRDLAGTADGKPLQRNPFGFVEGQGNPGAPAEVVLLPTGDSLAAVRVIRMAHEEWNHDDPAVQDRTIGRRRDGTWLDGTPATRTPRYTDDPDGAVIPLNAHARTMNPRTPDHPEPRMLRRSWIYQDNDEPAILFMTFQNNLTTGFALAQSRLPTDALHPYLLATGGGYFLVPAAS